MRPPIIATAIITAFLFAPTPTVGAAAAPVSNPSIARFEGRYIDLREGWDEATACASDNTTTECFRTEEEMDRYLGEDPGPKAPRAGNEATQNLATQNFATQDFAIQAVCSSSLRLYANTSYGGTVLALTTRLSFLNLSTWSFSNVTSSYKVGACRATFYDGASGGAPTYPGNTAAGASATAMLAGWDNRISSVYIS